MPPIRPATIIPTSSVYASIFSDPLTYFSSGMGAAFGALPPGWQFAFAIAFGLAVGSFVNVVAHRLPIMLERAWRLEISEATGQAADADGLPARYNLCVPRSACPHCGHVLRAHENIPILSYILLRGRCSACRAPIGLPFLSVSRAVSMAFVAWNSTVVG